VDLLSVQEGIEALSKDTPDRETTMVLMKSPQAAKRLHDGEVKYSALNVGGIGSAPGRKNIFKNIAVSEEESATLRYLMDKGVKITLLTVPGEKSKPLSKVISPKQDEDE
jgi:PTS system mannose-specific IIB component